MESRQFDPDPSGNVWLPAAEIVAVETPAAETPWGLLDLVGGQTDSLLSKLPPSDRSAAARGRAEPLADNPLAGPPSLEAAVRYFRTRTGRLPECKDGLINLISRDEAELDRLLSDGVNEVLHHPRFQALEAAWRGLWLLIEGAGGQENIKIKMLHLTKAQLDDDLHGAVEFDQSQLFRKVYEAEYGMAGGEPYGALIGNYEFRNSPGDIELLSMVKEVAAAAFAPFIAGVHPMMFGVPQFGLLERANLGDVFSSLKYVKWNSLREHEDSRYLGLVLPRILMRLPYTRDSQRVDTFVYEEDVSAADGSSYLWGNAAFAFGHVLVRAFALSGWFADIRGIGQGPGSGGVISLPAHSFRTDRPAVAVKCSVDTIVSEARDKELGDLGFIALCDCEDTEYSAFFANQSVQKPKAYNRNQAATTNAQMSSMLQYVLCASRFAHYLKAIGREKIGGSANTGQLAFSLHNWVQQYVAADPGASPIERAKRPLREAKVEVEEKPGDPGHLHLRLFLAPHVQLDQMSAGIRLITELPTNS